MTEEAEILTIHLTSSCLLTSFPKELPPTCFSGPQKAPLRYAPALLEPPISGAPVQNWEHRQEARQGKVGLWAESKGSESQLGRRVED